MSSIEASDPLEELQRENETTVRLLERILETAELCKAGTAVPPGEIGEELNLLEQYLEVHRKRLDEDLQPEARVVAMSSCFEHLDRLVREHSEARRRCEEARAALDEYSHGAPGARDRLASALETLATKDHETLVFEGDYPLSCLITTLPEEAAHRVAAQFTGSHGRIEDLEDHLQILLAAPQGSVGSPLTVHCSEEKCGQRSEARVVPVREGRMGLMAPTGGWSITPHNAEPGPRGRWRIRIDFRCPVHAETPPVANASGGAAAPSGVTGGPYPHSQAAGVAALDLRLRTLPWA